jgi:hypothetical protein
MEVQCISCDIRTEFISVPHMNSTIQEGLSSRSDTTQCAIPSNEKTIFFGIYFFFIIFLLSPAVLREFTSEARKSQTYFNFMEFTVTPVFDVPVSSFDIQF